jgi:pyridoxal phosphate enzyme (YggS family)
MHSITNDLEQSVTKVTEHLAQVQQRLAEAARAAYRDPEQIHLLAVSKGQSLAKIRSAYQAGQRSFGENYLQEAIKKMDAIRETDIEWHFIGRLQGNKAAKVAAHFSWVHTVDRAKLARQLNDHRPHYAPPLNVCLQVNLSGESQKGGADAAATAQLAGEVAQLPRLKFRGLMTVPPATANPEASRPYFDGLAQLQQELAGAGLPSDTLSMGMSGDLEVAVAAGATMVRIGTAVFGQRKR